MTDHDDDATAIKPVPVIMVGRDYWERAIDFDFLLEEGVIAREDRNIFWFAGTAEEAWQGILDWYAQAGEPLIPNNSDEMRSP